jgi:peptide/nickel transport system substrate-binding protein
VLVATCVAPAIPASGAARGGFQPGGVYHTAVEDFGFTGSFDPTGEYLGEAWGLYSMMLRGLMTYRHVGGLAGAVPVPDLATNSGRRSADGLTYTFHIKPGVKFGPPLNRDVTSQDVAYAFQRINTRSLVAQYGFYYDGVIKGMTGQAAHPAPVSGISTPDPHTIVFHLTKPTGDFLDRLAMPATAPIPHEVARCFTRAGDYGRDVISSGPYMIQGEQNLHFGTCSALHPIAGFVPARKMVLVRNPNYDPTTDSPQIRHNYVDGVSIVIDTNTNDIFEKIKTGQLDGSLASSPPRPLIKAYLSDPSRRKFLHENAGDRTWYVTMNLLTPPFDSVFVRRAVNWVLNKRSFLQSWGGHPGGDIAKSVFPPTVLPGIANYDPYATPNEAGSIAKAKAAMKQSPYDHNHDGVCDSSVCRDVLFLTRTTPPQHLMTSSIVDRLKAIGITLHVRAVDKGTGYTIIQTVKRLVPISAVPGWGKDYADPSTFAVLFDSSGISCFGQINYSEVGMTRAQAQACGVLSAWQSRPPPSVDRALGQCNSLSGGPRASCWVKFDHTVMEKIVPWVPYLWGHAITITNPHVSHYEFDQFGGIIALVNIAMAP